MGVVHGGRMGGMCARVCVCCGRALCGGRAGSRSEGQGVRVGGALAPPSPLLPPSLPPWPPLPHPPTPSLSHPPTHAAPPSTPTWCAPACCRCGAWCTGLASSQTMCSRSCPPRWVFDQGSRWRGGGGGGEGTGGSLPPPTLLTRCSFTHPPTQSLPCTGPVGSLLQLQQAALLRRRGRAGFDPGGGQGGLHGGCAPQPW